jgi:hypothetical protein
VGNKDLESSNVVAASDVRVTITRTAATCAVAIDMAVGVADLMLAAWQVADGVAFREIVRWQRGALRFVDMLAGMVLRVGDGLEALEWRT